MAHKALQHQMSRTVEVDRLELLRTLKENRLRHIEAYNEAMKGYKEMALAKVEEVFFGIYEKIDEAKAKIVKKLNTFSPETADKFSDRLIILQGEYIDLEVPRSFEEHYDAAIDMASFDVRDTLELSGAEFQCFCRDVWDWSYEFSNSVSNYTKVQ